MFLKTTKRIYNEEIDNYSSLLARIKNLLVKDEDYTGHNLSTIFLDNAKKKTLFQPIPILPISSGRVKTYEDRLKSEITLLEEEVAVLHGFYDKSIYEDSLFRGSNSLFESLKFIFSKGSMSLTKKELREKVRQLKAERKEALEQLYRKVSRQKNHLEKSRSLYSLLVDLREDLRRVTRKFINTSLDDEEEAYLISKNVFTHEGIRLDKNFFKNLINENKNYKCYSASTQ